MVTVVVSEEAVRTIAELPSPTVARMENLVARLRRWPAVSGVKRLRGSLAGHYRLRTGDYRLQFRVEMVRRTVRIEKFVKHKRVVEEQELVDVRIVVERAGHRDGFYED